MKPLGLTVLASVFSLAAMTSTALAATSGTQTVVETTHGWVSYHSSPKLSSPVVGQLRLGDEAPLVQKVNSYWYEIHWKNEIVYITTNANYTKLASVPISATTTPSVGTSTTGQSTSAGTTSAPTTSTGTSSVPSSAPTTLTGAMSSGSTSSPTVSSPTISATPTPTPAAPTATGTTTTSSEQYVETVQGWVSYHSSALLSSPVVGQLHLGDNAPLIAKVNSYWYEINWNNQDVYITTSPTYTKVVTLNSASTTVSGTTSTPSTGTSPSGTSTTSTGTTAGTSPSGTSGTSAPTSPASSTDWQTQADKVIATAETQLGVPYLWGKQEPGIGFDCSNFVAWSYKTALGIDFSGSSQTQRSSVGTPVALSDIREGDLLFFATKADPTGGGHVGIYMGNGQVIQEGGGWGKVTIEPLSGTWLGTNLVFARRVIN